MKAIAVTPGKPNSVHLIDVPKPTLDEIPDGRGVLVKLLSVGVDATDREINEAQYGTAPEGDDYLILGHESFGIVESVGENVTEFVPGDYVTATVRRPGTSIQDLIGTYDMTGDEIYYERGISLRHGFLTEYYVDDPEYIIKVPKLLKHLGVLMEPISIAEKAVLQVYEIQRRLRVWKPKIAYVMGAGQIGLLATLLLRQRGLTVYTMARSPKEGNLKAEIAAEMGSTYVSTKNRSLKDIVAETGAPDIIVEATGNSQVVFETLEIVGKNGVIVLTSVTGGDREVTIPADSINLHFVLGNKVVFGTVNANREYFESGVKSLSQAELEFPGMLEKILTSPVNGLENYNELLRLLVEDSSALKVFMNIATE